MFYMKNNNNNNMSYILNILFSRDFSINIAIPFFIYKVNIVGFRPKKLKYWALSRNSIEL